MTIAQLEAVQGLQEQSVRHFLSLSQVARMLIVRMVKHRHKAWFGAYGKWPGKQDAVNILAEEIDNVKRLSDTEIREEFYGVKRHRFLPPRQESSLASAIRTVPKERRGR